MITITHTQAPQDAVERILHIYPAWWIKDVYNAIYIDRYQSVRASVVCREMRDHHMRWLMEGECQYGVSSQHGTFEEAINALKVFVEQSTQLM